MSHIRGTFSVPIALTHSLIADEKCTHSIRTHIVVRFCVTRQNLGLFIKSCTYLDTCVSSWLQCHSLNLDSQLYDLDEFHQYRCNKWLIRRRHMLPHMTNECSSCSMRTTSSLPDTDLLKFKSQNTITKIVKQYDAFGQCLKVFHGFCVLHFANYGASGFCHRTT